MKNFKKLFIALPLVLVMLFMAVPVAAELKTDQVAKNTLGIDLKLGKYTTYTEVGSTHMVPIWGAVKTYQTDKNRADTPSYGAGWYKLLADGLPMTWVEASTLVDTPFRIGQNAVESHPVFADYVLPTYQINHVERVETSVRVPQSWTDKELDNAYIVKGNQKQVIEAGKEYPQDKVEAIDGLILNDDGTATYRGQKTTYTSPEVEKDVPATITLLVGEHYTYETEANTVNLIEGHKDLAKGLYDVTTLADNGFNVEDVANKITYEGVETKKVHVFKFADNLYTYPEGLDITNEVAMVNTVNGVHVATLKGQEGGTVIVNIDKVDKFVDATLWGLLVIVEEKYVDVKINHHYITGENEEIIQTSEEKQEKGVELTVNNIKAEWLKEAGEFKYDPTRTVITEKTNKNELVIGETIVESYVVDLFYTAGEGANADAIDAAFAGTNTAVANANVANLPATGAASNFALILSSAALAVVGLFLKK